MLLSKKEQEMHKNTSSCSLLQIQEKQPAKKVTDKMQSNIPCNVVLGKMHKIHGKGTLARISNHADNPTV